MIYYHKNEIVIRDLIESDAEIIAQQEQARGLLDKQPARYLRRLKDVADGKCVAIIHRTNDNDDKLIVVPDGQNPTNEYIEQKTAFQEQWFKHTIIR